MKELIIAVGGVVSRSILIVNGLALFWFFWGLMKFIFKAGDEKAQEEGRNIMLWGILALFVMTSVWGLVNFLGNSLGIKTGITQTQTSTVQNNNTCYDRFGSMVYLNADGTCPQ
jgi:hypothetical protein